jgi:hypothetical protein
MSLHLLLPLFASLCRTGRTRRRFGFHLLLLCHRALLPLEHHLCPPFDRGRRRSFANNVAKNLHPFVFRRSRVRIEIDDLPVREADSESLLDKHVALFFFCKRRLASSTLCRDFFLCKSGLVVNEFGGFGEVDSGTRLESRFVVGS